MEYCWREVGGCGGEIKWTQQECFGDAGACVFPGRLARRPVSKERRTCVSVGESGGILMMPKFPIPFQSFFIAGNTTPDEKVRVREREGKKKKTGIFLKASRVKIVSVSRVRRKDCPIFLFLKCSRLFSGVNHSI